MFWFIERKQLSYPEHESKKTGGQRIFREIFLSINKSYFWKKTTTS